MIIVKKIEEINNKTRVRFIQPILGSADGIISAFSNMGLSLLKVKITKGYYDTSYGKQLTISYVLDNLSLSERIVKGQDYEPSSLNEDEMLSVLYFEGKHNIHIRILSYEMEIEPKVSKKRLIKYLQVIGMEIKDLPIAMLDSAEEFLNSAQNDYLEGRFKSTAHNIYYSFFNSIFALKLKMLEENGKKFIYLDMDRFLKQPPKEDLKKLIKYFKLHIKSELTGEQFSGNFLQKIYKARIEADYKPTYENQIYNPFLSTSLICADEFHFKSMSAICKTEYEEGSLLSNKSVTTYIPKHRLINPYEDYFDHFTDFLLPKYRNAEQILIKMDGLIVPKISSLGEIYKEFMNNEAISYYQLETGIIFIKKEGENTRLRNYMLKDDIDYKKMAKNGYRKVDKETLTNIRIDINGLEFSDIIIFNNIKFEFLLTNDYRFYFFTITSNKSESYDLNKIIESLFKLCGIFLSSIKSIDDLAYIRLAPIKIVNQNI